MRSIVCAVLVLAAAASPGRAQEIRWQSEFSFYGDNTEFFTPYRVGETILGVWFKTFLAARTGERTEVRLGVFGDHRSGDTGFLETVKPVLSFRYHTDTTEWRIGSLDPVERHGYLEPLEVTTLEFTRPIEYGFEWKTTHERLRSDAYLNWQHLNTPSSREIFDYGFVVRADLARFVAIEVQHHGLHHGGQLYDVGPVANNVVVAGGLRLHTRLEPFGEVSLAGFQLHSSGKVDLAVPGPTINGGGTYLRASAAPRGWFELFAIWWKGKNFISTEGDHNYGSVGNDPSYYRADRRYQELGIVHSARIESAVDVDLEARLHRIDGTVEYSYRFLVHVPLDLLVYSAPR